MRQAHSHPFISAASGPFFFFFCPPETAAAGPRRFGQLRQERFMRKLTRILSSVLPLAFFFFLLLLLPPRLRPAGPRRFGQERFLRKLTFIFDCCLWPSAPYPPPRLQLDPRGQERFVRKLARIFHCCLWPSSSSAHVRLSFPPRETAAGTPVGPRRFGQFAAGAGSASSFIAAYPPTAFP